MTLLSLNLDVSVVYADGEQYTNNNGVIRMFDKTNKRKRITVSLFVIGALILIAGGFYILKAPKNDMNDVAVVSQPILQEKAQAKFELKANKKQLIVNPDALKGIRLGQGRITIPGTAPVAAPEPLNTREEKEMPKAKPARDYTYVGVSIANTSGKIIHSLMVADEQNDARQSEMIFVENMGLPQGVDSRPQSVRDLAQKGMESKELKRLKEIRFKRNANFAEELEARRARKGLYDR